MTNSKVFVARAHALSAGAFSLMWTTVFLAAGWRLGIVLRIWEILGGAAMAALVGLIGLFPGDRYFSIKSPERLVRVCRGAGIVLIRSWVVDGDRMNAALRSRISTYRVLGRDVDRIEAYSSRTRDMERIHLACFLASGVILVLALLGSAWRLAIGIAVLTLISNALPILLQRFNRARCQLVIQRRRVAQLSRQAPESTRPGVTLAGGPNSRRPIV